MPRVAYALKTAVAEPVAATLAFPGEKTMYGGRRIAAGDLIFLFASENGGGRGLVAKGEVVSAQPVPRRPGVARQTPRVGIEVRRTGLARRALGRRELKAAVDGTDGRPETELNFKFYRQATNKIVGLSPATAEFLLTFF